MGLIYYLSSMSAPPNAGKLFDSDVYPHMIVYSGLGFLLMRAFEFEFEHSAVVSPEERRAGTVFSTLITGALYALSDEIHQIFVPPRAYEIKDLVSDFSGLVIGIVLLFLLSRLPFVHADIPRKKNLLIGLVAGLSAVALSCLSASCLPVALASAPLDPLAVQMTDVLRGRKQGSPTIQAIVRLQVARSGRPFDGSIL
jgi:hypothetical protein